MLKTLRIAFYIILCLFLLDIFVLFQTKIGFFKTLIYYSVLFLPLPLLVLEFKAKRGLSKPYLRKGSLIVVIMGLIYLNPLKIIFNIEPWETRTITLVNKNKEDHKVEFQMKDIGALGYAKRNAEVYYLTQYFYIVLSKKYDERNFIGTHWKKNQSSK